MIMPTEDEKIKVEEFSRKYASLDSTKSAATVVEAYLDISKVSETWSQAMLLMLLLESAKLTKAKAPADSNLCVVIQKIIDEKLEEKRWDTLISKVSNEKPLTYRGYLIDHSNKQELLAVLRKLEDISRLLKAKLK